MSGDQSQLVGSGIRITLKTGLKHTGQLVHIDPGRHSILLRCGRLRACTIQPKIIQCTSQLNYH